jgi:hypothetical protein
MMGGMSPETCWASYKYEIKFWYTVASCWIFYTNYVTSSWAIFFSFHIHSAWQRPATTRPTTLPACKTRGCQCSFRLLMMDDVSPETCWASYKYKTKFWWTGILLDFLYELYYDARIHKHQVDVTSQQLYGGGKKINEDISRYNLISKPKHKARET